VPGAGVVMIATSGFGFKGITTPSLGAPPLPNQEGNYPGVSIVAGERAGLFQGCFRQLWPPSSLNHFEPESVVTVRCSTTRI
jgi:hypothetical protein